MAERVLKGRKLEGACTASLQHSFKHFSHTVLFYIVVSTKAEDPDLNNKLIRRYGVPKSRIMTSSMFMSPIGQEHYELFEPLTDAFHDLLQQAHGFREEDKKEDDSTWCTRLVSLLVSKIFSVEQI